MGYAKESRYLTLFTLNILNNQNFKSKSFIQGTSGKGYTVYPSTPGPFSTIRPAPGPDVHVGSYRHRNFHSYKGYTSRR